MKKMSNRGEYSKEQGDIPGRKKTALVSYLEGTKPNPKLAHKSLTPKAKMKKK